MPLEIELNDETPIYLQIINGVRAQVASGQLEPGEELPSSRALALKLKINPNTVVRAYGELEKEGVVRTRRTRGTYVADAVDEVTAQRHRLQQLTGQVDALLEMARQWQVRTEDVIQLLRERDVADQG